MSDASPRSKLEEVLGEELMGALALASLAPSGHNAQPWAVRVHAKERWRIGTEKSRWLPAVDPENREVMLSLGAFLENLAVAAGSCGYALEYEVTAHNAADSEIIDVGLRKSAISSGEVEKIRQRRTVRDGQQTKEIRPEDVDFITASVEGVRYFPRGSPQAKYLEESTIEANRTQAYRDPAQVELAEWIRWSKSDANTYRNGLTPASLEIQGLPGWFVAHFYDRSNVLSKRFRETSVQRVVELVRQGAGWLVLTSADPSVSSLIEAGRRVEQMWLRLRERSIGMHPMSQVLEETPWRHEVMTQLGMNQPVQFLLRVGYREKYPKPVSMRMPVDRFAALDSE